MCHGSFSLFTLKNMEIGFIISHVHTFSSYTTEHVTFGQFPLATAAFKRRLINDTIPTNCCAKHGENLVADPSI